MSTVTSAIDRLVGGIQDALVERAIVAVSVKDVVRMTGLAERTVRRYIAEGRIKSTKVGRKVLLDYQNVKRFVRSNGNGAA